VLTTPIPVIGPLLMAALLAALNRRVPRPVAMLLAILTSAGVGLVAISLVVNSRYDPIVYWFGGWEPRNRAAIGICFVVDNAGAMLVLLAAILTTASLVFSWCYFDTAGTLFQVLMLVFLGAMSGFALTGDLFNLFVFFELMSVSAFALCGYKSESPGPLQGALNFAVTNTVGAFLGLSGIALLYGRTGALNMAQIGRTLEGAADPLVLVAFTFLVCGFFVKAAVVPFHFWLADAHAVAPAPVCVLFSGIMVELGLYAVARIYWAVFSGVMGPFEGHLRNLLAGFGAVTAVAGALMCYAQRHLKRLLAFSTVSHIGLMLLGISLLTPEGLAGASIYAMGHAMIKGGLFLAAGILLHRTGTVDEIELTARIRHLRWTGALFFLGAAGLAGVPPFGTFWGENMMDASAAGLGYGWMGFVFFLAAGVTAAAVFRFGGRVFLRWGPPAEEFPESGSRVPEKRDTAGGHWHTPGSMYVPAAGLMILGAMVGLAPGLTGAAESAALHLENRPAYAARVLDRLTPYPPTVHDQPATGGDLRRALGTVLSAMLLAGVTLGSARVRRTVGRNRALAALVKSVRDLHSGVIPDYVTWLIAGVAVFGAAVLLTMRR
jgi:multicomponent Na+:H+ antiporter subunit D